MTPEETAALQWALTSLLSRASHYRKARDYYEGRQPLAFATSKFNEAFGNLFSAFADNVCGVVVDTVADRLQVAGFTVADAPETEDGRATPVEQRMREIWRRNRMNVRAGEVHQDALADADAYVIVWPDAENLPVLYPNRGPSVAVRYDAEQPGYITQAAKAWTDDEGYTRVNVFHRDRIEKYRSTKKAEGGAPDKAHSYAEFEVPGEAWPLPNPYDKVPVFHFANRASVGAMGRAEHSEAMPLQDALNKSVADMLVAMEFYALPQRWATGLAGGDDPRMKPGGVWAVDTADTKFGEFAPGDITKFLEVAEGFRKEIARVSRTPAHYFSLTAALPSGESLKTAEGPLLAKVSDKQQSWGNVWADVMRFALIIGGVSDTDPETVWKDVTPRNERDLAEVAEIKERLGVPRRQLQREMGYEAAEIAKFEEERATRDILPETFQ